MTSSFTTTTAPARNPSLDGLRGLAVLMLYAFQYGGGFYTPHHPVPVLGQLLASGWVGFSVFFALSGFLITGTLLNSRELPHLLRNFLARRALLILPLYLAVVTASFILSLGHGSSFGDAHNFYIYYFFLQDLPVLAGRAAILYTPIPLQPFWALAVIAQFYLVWPLLLLPLPDRRSKLRLALGTYALSVIFIWVAYCLPPLAAATPHSFDHFAITHAGALGLGSALAILSRRNSWQVIQQRAPVILLCAVAVFTLSGLVAGRFDLTGPLQYCLALPAASVAAAAALVIALDTGRFSSLLRWPPLAHLGRISYGFFIFLIALQPAFGFLAARWTHARSGLPFESLRFLIGLPLTFIVAEISFHLLEIPFLQWKTRFPLRQPLAPESHSAAQTSVLR